MVTDIYSDEIVVTTIYDLSWLRVSHINLGP